MRKEGKGNRWLTTAATPRTEEEEEDLSVSGRNNKREDGCRKWRYPLPPPPPHKFLEEK